MDVIQSLNHLIINSQPGFTIQQSMKQEVINYEFDLIQQEVSTSPHFPRHDPGNFRYSSWDLYSTLQKITDNPHSIKWIGNAPNSSVLGFFYCMLVGSLKEEGCDSQAFVKLKFILYQLCRQFLTVKEQKTFVEHLCLVEYSKSVTDFLKKSQHLESILIKIFCSYRRQIRNKNRKTNQQNFQNNPIFFQLKGFSALFPFLSLEILEEKVVKISVNGSLFHLIQEKECIFVIQHVVDRQTNHHSIRKENFQEKMDNMSTNKKIHKQKFNFYPENEEQKKHLEYPWVKKPKIMLNGNGLVQSVACLHLPKSDDSQKNSGRKKQNVGSLEKEPTQGRFSYFNVSSQQNVSINQQYPKVRGSVKVGRGSHKINQNESKKLIQRYNNFYEENSEIIHKKWKRNEWSQSADKKSFSIEKIQKEKKKVPLFLQKKCEVRKKVNGTPNS